MGNHHSDTEHQGKGNLEAKPENSPKPKKDNDLWSNFRKRDKASTVTETSPFKPVPPNLFKGVPNFTSTASTAPVGKTQTPPMKVPSTQERLIKPDSALNPTAPLFTPKGLHSPSQLWGPKEPSAYNITWERPAINSPMPPSLASFGSPPDTDAPQVDFQRAVSPTTTTTTSAARTVAIPRKKWPTPRPKTPPIVPKKAWPKPLAPETSVMPREPGPILPQPPITSPKSDTKMAIEEITPDPVQPFCHTDENVDQVQACQQSSTPTADREAVASDQTAKSPSNQENNAAAHDQDSKDSDKAKIQSFVFDEQTNVQILSRLAYVEQQPAPDAQNPAVVRKALNGASFAEAVKTSQPKVNPARREAKAKSSKKAKASKLAKQAQTQTAASPTEGGSSDPPEPPANNSSTSHLQLRETHDMAVTQTRNAKATPLNEQPAISLANTEREASQLTSVDSASLKVYPEDHNQTQNSCLVSGKSPSATGKTLSPSCQAGNSHDSISMAVPSKSPAADLKGISSVSSHQTKPNPTPQSAPTDPLHTIVRIPEQESRIDREEAKQSSALQVNSNPGPKEESAAMDTSADLTDCSDGRTISISREPPKTPSPRWKNLNPDAPCFNPDLIPFPPPYPPPCGPYAAPGRSYRTLSGEHVPPIALPQGPPSMSAQVHPPPQSTTPAQASEQKTKKLLNNPAPQPTNAETNELSETNEHKKTEEKVPVQPSPPPSPQPPPRPEGRWHPFTTDRTCLQKVRCQHHQNGSLPKNVLKWQNVSQNHLCEPPWVTTASLAASIALSARLDRQDSRQ